MSGPQDNTGRWEWLALAATAFILVALPVYFFTGGGRYFSLDYWLGRFTGGVAVSALVRRKERSRA